MSAATTWNCEGDRLVFGCRFGSMGYRTAILIFDEVEVLDFAGPFEVFSVTGRRQKLEPFDVYTVAERAGPVLARNGLSINPRYSFADCPTPEILVVPGGFGTRREMKNPVMIEWISRVAPNSFGIWP